MSEKKAKGSLIIVANRLPVTLSTEDGEVQLKRSSGGLVTALKGMNQPFKWVGWLGSEVNDVKLRKDIEEELLLDSPACYPVYLDKKEADLFYNGFSNSILWPLFHYMFEKTVRLYKDMDKAWKAYQEVNEKFAETVMKIYKEGDLVWVQDYQLMLLPKILRSRNKTMPIGFFLHISFPSNEIYRTLPVRVEILEGILASNLIGFHTYDYARHFISSCTKTLGSVTTPNGLYHRGLYVKVRAFPIGINPEQFANGVRTEAARKRYMEFAESFKGKKVLIGVDRLDYTKGVNLKFMAFKRFLEKYPEFKDKVVLFQVGVPTRENVLDYKQLMSEVNELVGQINSTYGTLGGFPLHYINRSVPFPDLCALYAIADACIVSSIRDGMNLVSSEYVVCQDEAHKLYKKEHGVLILSEFAGAARSLGGSIIINPWDIEHCADAFYQAITLPSTKKTALHTQNYSVISKNTAGAWGQYFIDSFNDSIADDSVSSVSILPNLTVEKIKDDYLKATKRLFILDYDGTLVNITSIPSLATPTQPCLEALKKLIADPKNVVYIMSGRDKKSLTEFLGDIKGLGICAEHGMFVRHPDSTEWESLYNLQNVDLSWLGEVKRILMDVEKRTPGSFVEEKETSLVFHFRNCDPVYGQWQANELKMHFDTMFTSSIDVVQGKKILEFRPVNISKGFGAKKLLSLQSFDFCFVAGDDGSDEDTFKAVRQQKYSSYCCLVRKLTNVDSVSAANISIAEPNDLITVLGEMAELKA
jgi:trehalose 6-phosphate synthase/phosphatase